MMKRDYLLKQLERLGALIARVLRSKAEQNLDEAFQEVTLAHEEIFAKHRDLIRYADSTTLANMLGDDGLVRGLAALTAAEAELYDAKGDAVTATMKRLRALELYVEAKLGGTRADDGDTIRALAASVPDTLIPERYRPHLA
jgi:hypothetical protein